ncbi:hypothetical protein [Spirosoma aerophilum]
MTREQLLQFYSGTDYKIIRRNPARPSEWHIPLLINETIKSHPDVLNEIKEKAVQGRSEINLTNTNCLDLRATLLHESIFNLYKAFYNYLATKRLYKGGAEHWIEITNYYSKLYLARSINTLAGIQTYSVQGNRRYFNREVLEIIKPKDIIKFDNGERRVNYTIDLKLNIEIGEGKLIFHKQGISTHKDIWDVYKSLKPENLGFYRLDEFSTDEWDLIDERNKENYSFDGYFQVDFNLPPISFEQYFDRHYLIETSKFIYDETVGSVLQNFQEIYHLLNEMNIDNLPIEIEKFHHMIDFMLDDSEEKTKLIDLCERGFPLENEYQWEINSYYER